MKTKINFNYTFCRVEKKFLLNEIQYNKFISDLIKHMTPDNFGLSTICNIYFDSENNDMIRASLDKPEYKEKLRLRSYGVPNQNDTVFLELKKKFDGIVFKRRISLLYKDAIEYIKIGKKPDIQNQILHEIDYAMNFYQPIPKLFLAYERIAYVDNDNSDLRITIDKNIRARNFNLALDEGAYGSLILDKDLYLVEIKVLNAYPLWLVKILSEQKLYPVSFSKYGKFYSEEIRGELNV